MAEVTLSRPEEKQEWIRPPEWARRTSMSTTETYRLIYSGDLRARKIGKMWFIRATEILDFFERCNDAA